MKFNKIIPFGLMCVGLSLTGCGNNSNTDNNMSETTTNSSISNNINGVFDGYRYNTNDYYSEYSTYDRNYYNGYTTTSDNYSNTRFGDGMKGAENIKGNENKTTSEKISSDINNMYYDGQNTYNNLKNSIKD